MNSLHQLILRAEACAHADLRSSTKFVARSAKMSEEAPKKKGGGMMLWILVPVIAGGAGFGTSRVMFPTHTETEVEDQSLAAPNASDSTYVPFEDVTVNLNDQRLSRYLHVAISLQIHKAEEEEFKELLELHRPALRTWMLSYLSELSTDDIRGSQGQQRIRREIQSQFNSVLYSDGYDHIYDVMLEQFNVQ
jgi:flagellar basal body-associated protein FliL